MKWLWRGMMAAGMIGSAVVTAGILPLAWGVVFTAVTGAAGFFHPQTNGNGTPPAPPAGG